MRTLKFVLFVFSLGIPAAIAQQRELDPNLSIPKVDIELGYDHINANAPPGGCPCFGVNGGFVTGGYQFTDKFSAVGEFTGGTAGNISMLGQDLTLTIFLAGPRFTEQIGRFAPFAQLFLEVPTEVTPTFPSPRPAPPVLQAGLSLPAAGWTSISLTASASVRSKCNTLEQTFQTAPRTGRIRSKSVLVCK